MRTLLDDRYAPIASDVTFFEAPLQTLGNLMSRDVGCLFGMLFPGRVLTPVSQPFPNVLDRVPPMRRFPDRYLLLATKSSWVAYFHNGTATGSNLPWIAREKTGCRTVRVVCIPHTVRRLPDTGHRRQWAGRYGVVSFELHQHGGDGTGGPTRTMMLCNDGGRWEFHEGGEVQAFEKPEHHQAQRVRDRFTCELLDEYCSALGIRYFDPGFYGPDGLLVAHPLSSLGGESLAHAQTNLGIVRAARARAASPTVSIKDASGSELLVLDAETLVGADLIKARLPGAILRRRDLSGAEMHRANLTGADLREARLDGADLSGACLAGASLRGASVRDTRLVGADLTRCDVRGTDLSGAQLDGATLDGVRDDATTVWPSSP